MEATPAVLQLTVLFHIQAEEMHSLLWSWHSAEEEDGTDGG